MLKNLEKAVNEKFVYKKLAAQALDMHPGNLSKLIATPEESVEKLWNATKIKIEKVFPEYNIDWLLGKSEIKYKEDIHIPNKISKSNGSLDIHLNNGNALGEIADDETYMFDEEGNTRFYEISPGVYRMKVPLINETAKAGSLTGFADAEFLENQECICTTVYRYHKGKYRAFRVVGDSMDVDKRTTFIHGDILVGREIKRELWKSRFHTHKYPFYVFVTKNEGIIFKELLDHDVENGVVTLQSLNEDKVSYPNFNLNLNDIALIFNVVKREVEI